MTQKEFNEINWHRGNVAKLKNGKEYFVKGTKGHGRYLLLYSAEYDAKFIADYRIVDSRTSDYEEPDEVYQELKRRKQEEAREKRELERLEHLRAKQERKLRNLKEQERIHQEALARKAARINKNAEKMKKKNEALKPIAEPKPVVEKPKLVVEKPKPVVEKAMPVVEKVKTVVEKVKAVVGKPAVEKPVAKAEPVATHDSEATTEQPKRKRKRIIINRAEKIEIK